MISQRESSILEFEAGLTSSGDLVYEYIGEVVAEKTFRKRLQQYADEGLRHFYFMMLQKEEVGPYSPLKR
jgi:hypothetical protein